MIAAKDFVTSDGVRFVAAIFVLYEAKYQISFKSLGVDPFPLISAPLGSGLDQVRIDLATDPREVEAEWVDDVLKDAPFAIEKRELSHNSAESVSELIRLSLPYALLLWNPFVKTIANEAAKDFYGNASAWLKNLWNKLQERRDPIVVLQTSYRGCEIFFLFRGKDVEKHYSAHAKLSAAAKQAGLLIDNLTMKVATPLSLTYEFEESKWFPSYASLADGRIVSDRGLLIAIEQLPTGLSLGLRKTKRNKNLK